MKKLRWPKLKKFKGNPSAAQKTEQVARKVFGFEKVDRDKHCKSPELNETAVISTLAKLETDMNWIKRLVWLLVAGTIGTQFIP